jgi:hypothetical protein
VKVKSKKYFSFTDFFAKIKPLLTHVHKTPPLRSRYSTYATSKNMGEICKWRACGYGHEDRPATLPWCILKKTAVEKDYGDKDYSI